MKTVILEVVLCSYKQGMKHQNSDELAALTKNEVTSYFEITATGI